MKPLPWQSWANRKTGKAVAVVNQHESGQVIYRYRGTGRLYYTDQKRFVKNFKSPNHNP